MAGKSSSRYSFFMKQRHLLVSSSIGFIGKILPRSIIKKQLRKHLPEKTKQLLKRQKHGGLRARNPKEPWAVLLTSEDLFHRGQITRTACVIKSSEFCTIAK